MFFFGWLSVKDLITFEKIDIKIMLRNSKHYETSPVSTDALNNYVTATFCVIYRGMNPAIS